MFVIRNEYLLTRNVRSSKKVFERTFSLRKKTFGKIERWNWLPSYWLPTWVLKKRKSKFVLDKKSSIWRKLLFVVETMCVHICFFNEFVWLLVVIYQNIVNKAVSFQWWLVLHMQSHKMFALVFAVWHNKYETSQRLVWVVRLMVPKVENLWNDGETERK